jgi:hypothetical protein
VSAVSPGLLLVGCGLLVRGAGAACDVERSPVRKTVRLVLIIFNEITALFTEVGSAACFSGPQYTIPQLCYRSAQNAIPQCFQICQCAMRNAALRILPLRTITVRKK